MLNPFFFNVELFFQKMLNLTRFLVGSNEIYRYITYPSSRGTLQEDGHDATMVMWSIVDAD